MEWLKQHCRAGSQVPQPRLGPVRGSEGRKPSAPASRGSCVDSEAELHLRVGQALTRELGVQIPPQAASGGGDMEEWKPQLPDPLHRQSLKKAAVQLLDTS